ncbi:helix-turn-helix domain-containing protein [Chloroflexota bacterium]
MATPRLDINQVRKSFTDFIEKGSLDKRVIDALIVAGIFVPKESELWDYKRETGKEAVSLAETVLTIVSFYNTYGGYLIYGIDEITDDSEFTPYGITNGDLDLGQLRQLITNYIGEPIDISYIELEYDTARDRLLYGLLHIPKRPSNKSPAFFGKAGPIKKNGRPVFQKDCTYIRVLDQCLPATNKQDYQLLFSDRNNDYLWNPDLSLTAGTSKKIVVENNLPNRNFICPKFLGRETELQALWRWLGDELSNTKVLAGDGGKGKTSIAYEFAEEVCQTKPYNIDKVIWLTAKSKQFVAELDKYISVPRTDFYDIETLLVATCKELAILEDEIEGASIPMLKKYMKNGLENILCLIIIDNVDSTDDEQQKQIFETAMQFPGSKARFLLTTRMNKIYSTDQCISVTGFNQEDYHKYVYDVLSRFTSPLISPKQINLMYVASNGSPLFTESILRLYKNGITIKQAIHNWQGKEGKEVRMAALLHEIEQLSAESKRILLATTYMKEASFTELRQVTGYTSSSMQKHVNELKSFFLLETKPFIKKESRFMVPENAANLVAEIAQELVPSPDKLRNIIIKYKHHRFPSTGSRNSLDPALAAINQAKAMLRENNIVDAIDTIKAGLNISKNHPDLLLELAVSLFKLYQIKEETSLFNESRSNFKKSYDAGQRKESLFVFWFEVDTHAKDYVSAIEISSLALQQKNINRVEWLKNRASVFSKLAKSMESGLNIDLAIDNMKKAARDIGRALKESNELQKLPIMESLSRYDDTLWALCSKQPILDFSGYIDLFELARFIVRIEDNRFINYKRLFVSLINAIKYLIDADKASHGQISLMQSLCIHSQTLLNLQRVHFNAQDKENINRINQELQDSLKNLIEKFRR